MKVTKEKNDHWSLIIYIVKSWLTKVMTKDDFHDKIQSHQVFILSGNLSQSVMAKVVPKQRKVNK